ncbi:MAG: hypothetical protein K5930_02360 [Treponemataceae bacterium]|nr:hypothetical protein [Treponemataceae bacterium]
MNSIRNHFNEKFYIPELDLADVGESNRLVLLFLGPCFFVFGFVDFTVVFVRNYSNLKDHLVSLIYFSIFTLISIYVFICSKKNKNIDREKAYIKKTIPFYMLCHTCMLAALYNFYILDQPFNGYAIFCLTGTISLCLFSFSPFPFLIGLVLEMIFMGPGLYFNFGISGLADGILTAMVMFWISLYKRRLAKKHLMLLKKQKKNLEAKTFGNFTLLFENKIVKFSRTKSNELFGYLVYKKGSSVNSKELISILWGDSADSTRYGNNLRNLIVDIKHTLKDLSIDSVFIAEYNNFRINPEIINCDYYDFLAGKKEAVDSFAGEFMSQYSWAEDVSAFLEMKAIKKE